MRKFFNVITTAIILLLVSQTINAQGIPTPFKKKNIGKTTEKVFHDVVSKAIKGDMKTWGNNFECSFPDYIHTVMSELDTFIVKHPEYEGDLPAITAANVAQMLVQSNLELHKGYETGERQWRVNSKKEPESFPAKGPFDALVFVYPFTHEDKSMKIDLIIHECWNPKEIQVWEVASDDVVYTPGPIQFVDTCIGKQASLGSFGKPANTPVNNPLDTFQLAMDDTCTYYVYLDAHGRYQPYTPTYSIDHYFVFEKCSPVYKYFWDRGHRPLFYDGCQTDWKYCYYPKDQWCTDDYFRFYPPATCQYCNQNVTYYFYQNSYAVPYYYVNGRINFNFGGRFYVNGGGNYYGINNGCYVNNGGGFNQQWHVNSSQQNGNQPAWGPPNGGGQYSYPYMNKPDPYSNKPDPYMNKPNPYLNKPNYYTNRPH